jgi:hypothetical protein
MFGFAAKVESIIELNLISPYSLVVFTKGDVCKTAVIPDKRSAIRNPGKHYRDENLWIPRSSRGMTVVGYPGFHRNDNFTASVTFCKCLRVSTG